MEARIDRNFISRNLSWRNVFITAGIAILAPYVIRRLMPLFQGNMADLSAKDVAIAGKDSVRDVADDMNVGGVGGTLNRGIDRVTDRLSH